MYKFLENRNYKKTVDSNNHNNKTINRFYCNQMHANCKYGRAFKCITRHYSSLAHPEKMYKTHHLQRI